MQRVISLKSVNPHLMCVLCGQYLTEATTIVECLHSFCKPCILRYLETSFNCPVCDTEIHKTKPHLNIRSDPTLQEIVYKLVPGLYEAERRRKQEAAEHGKRMGFGDPGPSSKADIVNSEAESPDRTLVTLRYFKGPSKLTRAERLTKLFPTRYLCCPSNLPVQILKKFVRRKFDLPLTWEVDIWRGDEALLDYLTLKDIVRIYGVYRERKPLEIHFSVLPPEDEFKEDLIDVPSIARRELENSPLSQENENSNDSILGKRLSVSNDANFKRDDIKKRTLEDIANITSTSSAVLTSPMVR